MEIKMEKRRKGGAHLAPKTKTAGHQRSLDRDSNAGKFGQGISRTSDRRAESVCLHERPRQEDTASYRSRHEETSRAPKTKKRKGSHKGGVIGVCTGGVLLVLLSLALIITTKLNKIDYNDGKVASPVDPKEIASQKETALDISGLETKEPVLAKTEMKSDEDVLNILLLGTDERELEFTDDARADTVMILSLDFKNTTAKLVSIQRGTGMPMLEGQYKDHYDMITCCFAYGGADLLMRQIQQCFKIDVNRYVRVNLNMLIKVIDVLGGVDVALTEQEAWYLNIVREGGDTGFYLNQGFVRGDGSSEEYPFVEGDNHLTGVMALAYARLRAIDDDWHRVQRQRTVLQACAEKLKDADLATLNDLANAVLPLVRTNFTKTELAGLALKAPSMLKAEIGQMTLPAEGTYGGMKGLFDRDVLALDFNANSQILQEFLYGKK